MASQLRSPLREAHPNPSVPTMEPLKPQPLSPQPQPQPQPQPLSPQPQPQPQPQPLSPQPQPQPQPLSPQPHPTSPQRPPLSPHPHPTSPHHHPLSPHPHPISPQTEPLSPQPQPLPPLLPAPPEPNHQQLPPPPPPASIVNRAAREQPGSVTKMEDGKGGVVQQGRGVGGSKAVSDIIRRDGRGTAVRTAGIGFRLLAAVLALISFSVMAADKTKGWAGDSFERYREYRYCMSVNVITFAYSSFQSFMHLHETITGKHIMHPPTRYYFDLFMDQALAYLLISASTAAATRNDDWVTNWGSDPFTVMINGSLSMSFLAFVAVASSALISAYNLFSRDIQ